VSNWGEEGAKEDRLVAGWKINPWARDQVRINSIGKGLGGQGNLESGTVCVWGLGQGDGRAMKPAG